MSIFSNLFTDKRMNVIDTQIDKIISGSVNQTQQGTQEDKTASSINNFFDILGQADSNSKKDINKLFDNVTVPRERLARYDLYEELYRTVPIIKRIMRVYKANILQKNPVTGKSILYKELRDKEAELGPEKFKANSDKTIEFAKKVVDMFQIDQKLSSHIIPRQTLYGDCFVEIVDVVNEDVKITDKMNYLSEVRDFSSFLDNSKNQYNEDSIDDALYRLADLLVEVDDTDIDQDKKNQEQELSLNNIVVKFHKPHQIVILETDYGTRLGYFEVSKSSQATSSPDIGRMMSGAINKLNNLANKNATPSNEMVNKLIGFIIKKILEKNKKYVKSRDADSVLKTLGDDLYFFIKKLFIEQSDYKDKLQNVNRVTTRFIPANRMVQFSIPSADHLPFGESIIDPLVFPAKLYVLSQLANIITKLSRASLVRTWTIETGATLMHSELAQKLKRELYNSRVTLEDLGNFKSMPKILSDYKDMFLFSKGGQKSVDVDIKSYGDPAIKVADLEDARREIIALSGIPAPYLGYMDVVELREQLVHSNVSFATEIVDIQENINEGLTKIVDIIAEICNIPIIPSEYVTVCTIPPIVLLLQLTEMTISSAGNIMNVFAGLEVQFDPYFFLEKYVPYLDWDEFRKAAEEKTKTKITTAELTQPPPQQM